jgi:hypothetical protein
MKHNINKNCYIKANGHSNLYWGWGLIDINFHLRLRWCGLEMFRYNNTVKTINDNGYFVSLNANTLRFEDDENYKNNYIIDNKTLNGKIDWKQDGLNNVEYKLKDKTVTDYTRYKIDF